MVESDDWRWNCCSKILLLWKGAVFIVEMIASTPVVVFSHTYLVLTFHCSQFIALFLVCSGVPMSPSSSSFLVWTRRFSLLTFRFSLSFDSSVTSLPACSITQQASSFLCLSSLGFSRQTVSTALTIHCLANNKLLSLPPSFHSKI